MSFPRAFRASHLDGVFYFPGHDPSGSEAGVALFSSAPGPPVVQRLPKQPRSGVCGQDT